MTKSVQQNDACVNADPIIPGDVISGTTTAATEDGLGHCGTSNTAPGVWYKTVGTGDVFTASTCDAADYDTKISVFEGVCGTLTCVDGNDDAEGCSNRTSIVEFITTSGGEYLILVHGFFDYTGNFDLTLISAP